MKTVDTTLIMSFRPCREWPESRVREAVPEEIPLVDFLRAKHIPPDDRLWVAIRPEFCTESIMRIFACDCAENSLLRERDAGRDPDERSWAAVDVARQHARGEATDDDLDAACAAADAAAARKAAWSAAWEAAGAAWSAAARADAWAAAWDAGAAARADEVEWQCIHLAKMLEGR